MGRCFWRRKVGSEMVQVRLIEPSSDICPFETFVYFIKLEASFPFHPGFLIIFQAITGNYFFAVIFSPHKQVESADLYLV